MFGLGDQTKTVGAHGRNAIDFGCLDQVAAGARHANASVSLMFDAAQPPWTGREGPSKQDERYRLLTRIFSLKIRVNNLYGVAEL